MLDTGAVPVASTMSIAVRVMVVKITAVVLLMGAKIGSTGG